MNTDSFPITLMSLMPGFSRAGLKIHWTLTTVYVGSILVDAGGQMIYMGHNRIYSRYFRSDLHVSSDLVAGIIRKMNFLSLLWKELSNAIILRMLLSTKNFRKTLWKSCLLMPKNCLRF